MIINSYVVATAVEGKRPQRRKTKGKNTRREIPRTHVHGQRKREKIKNTKETNLPR